jgi:hypothetical protein
VFFVRRASLIVAATLVFGTMVCLAQDQSPPDRPLGDVARETRAQTAQTTRPAKTLVSEGSDLHPVSASDDPVDVVTKAAAALVHDTSFRCEMHSSGNSGPRPGWSRVEIIETAGTDRVHTVGELTNPKRREETIYIGGEGYVRIDNGPWKKKDAMKGTRVNGGAMAVPDELKFGYKKGDLNLTGVQFINGLPTLHYQDKVRDIAIDRTIEIWIGSNDNLPRRTAMITHDLQMKTDWQETTDCTFGVHITIDPPL